jgi:hypothetical protein
LGGDRCAAPALRDEDFCRFHQSCDQSSINISRSALSPSVPFYFPVLEDSTSIHSTITQVCQQLLNHRLDEKKAALILYATQIASSNLARLSAERSAERYGKVIEEIRCALRTQAAELTATLKAQTESGSSNSSSPDNLPPETIQACEQSRHFLV